MEGDRPAMAPEGERTNSAIINSVATGSDEVECITYKSHVGRQGQICAAGKERPERYTWFHANTTYILDQSKLTLSKSVCPSWEACPMVTSDGFLGV